MPITSRDYPDREPKPTREPLQPGTDSYLIERTYRRGWPREFGEPPTWVARLSKPDLHYALLVVELSGL